MSAIPFLLDKTVRAIAAQIPAAPGMFEMHQIDDCCGANHPLSSIGYALRLDATERRVPPPDEVGSTCSSRLSELEQIAPYFHEHMHFQNNILFPRAAALEACAESGRL
jgi:iron-sulfur cluster repair protein YtfE (RIC family)